MCDSTQGSLCPSPMKIHQSMWIQRTFLLKLQLKVIDPYMTFDPTSVEVTCVTLPKDHCVQVPWEYINVCGYRDQFCKNYHIHTHTCTYYIHTHTTYTYYVQNQWSHSLFWTTFRRDKNWQTLFFAYNFICVKPWILTLQNKANFNEKYWEKHCRRRLSMMFRITHDHVDTDLKDFITKPTRPTRRHHPTSYMHIQVKSALYANSFFPWKITLWNSLPHDILDITNY